MATVQSVLSKATPAQLKAAILKSNFELFVKAAWQYVCPEPLVWELPQQVIVAHLQAIHDGKFPDNHTLTISVPPSSSKSLLTSVLFPSFVWASKPQRSFICATHTSVLTQRFASKFRALVESEWYQAHFQVKFADDTNSKMQMKNTAMGERIGVSVGGSITGSHADVHVCDDLVDASDANNASALEAANSWYDTVLSSRFKDANKTSSIIIAQRLSTLDSIAHVSGRPGTIVLSLPAVLDGAPCVTPVFTDPRSPGELLAPQRLPQAVLDIRRVALGTMAYSAQYQQNPIPIGGGMLKREWFSERHAPYATQGAIATPAKFSTIAVVVDAAFKGTSTSDRVAMLVVGVLQSRIYVLDMCWGNYDFVATVAALKKLVAKWRATEIAIEEAANGAAIISQLKASIGYGVPVIPIKPTGSKEARVSAASPNIEGGGVVLPLSFQSSSLTVEELILEAISFPKGGFDDGVDALCHAVARYCVQSDFWDSVEADKSVW